MWLTVSMSKLRPPSDVVRCVPGLVTWHTAATQHSSAQTFTTRRGSCEPGPAWRLGNQVERGTARSRAREMAVADSGATENLLYPLYSYFNFTLHYLNFPLLLLHAWNRSLLPSYLWMYQVKTMNLCEDWRWQWQCAGQARSARTHPNQRGTDELETRECRHRCHFFESHDSYVDFRFCSLHNLCLIFGAPFRENRVVFSLLVDNIRVHCQSNHISQAASTASNVLLCRTT